ncbi:MULTISPECIES: TolC family protein [unclassified Serratia (in: enterobacteria)]|uniref:TolC family protein n=1 Tax=unclassified Serratia (in: enterobacteria) TaxID=2647522 RepID=UPI003076227C
MACKQNELRWLKAAAALVVSLPLAPLAQEMSGLDTSTATQQAADTPSDAPDFLKSLTALDTSNGTVRASSAPAQQERASPARQPQTPGEAPDILKSLVAMDNNQAAPAQEKPAQAAVNSAAPVFTQRNEPSETLRMSAPAEPKALVPPPVPAPATQAPVLTQRSEPPASAPSMGSPTVQTLSPPPDVKATAAPVLVKRPSRDTNNSASAPTERQSTSMWKSNQDGFPATQQSFQPDPAYDKVRWNGDVNGEGGSNTKEAVSAKAFYAASNDTSRGFLRKMVTLALKHSPEVRSSEADVLAAGYYVDQTKGQRWPQVQLGLSTPLSAQSNSGGSNRNNRNISDTSGSVSITTPIYDWGRIGSQIDSAEEGVTAAVNAQGYTKEQLAYSTISELMNLGRYQESRKVARAYVERMQQLTNMLAQIAAADPGRASEFTQAKAKLLSARASLDDIEHQVSSSRIRLVRLLGVEPNLPEDISWQGAMMPASMALSALDKNPNLLKLQAQAKAATYEAESVAASGMPQLNWVVSKDTIKDVNGDETGWYTGLNVQWNAFSGGSQRAAQMSALAKANGAQQQYEVAYRDLEYQINSMIQTRDSSFTRANDFDRLSVETERVKEMFYEQWYNLGTRTLLDVLTAENDHFNNLLSAINNRYDGYISNINVISSAAMLLKWVGD